MNDAPLIEIHNATVWRGTSCVLEDFSLTIKQHERVAILGPNGSGKTTLLKTISRELRPVQKEKSWIKILGNPRWNVWELRKQLGLVSHELQASYSQRTTAKDVVASGFFSSVGLDEQLRSQLDSSQIRKAEAVMQQLGVAGLGERPYGSLSTGQQRRCLLGRALVHDPHTLILDEATTGLDMTARFEIQRLVSVLVKQGTGLVWVTHDLNDIPLDVQRVIVLKNGTVFADGSKSEVLTQATLKHAFDTNLQVAELDGHYLAFPAAD